jgi:hypothetical protein
LFDGEHMVLPMRSSNGQALTEVQPKFELICDGQNIVAVESSQLIPVSGSCSLVLSDFTYGGISKTFVFGPIFAITVG